MSVDWNRIAKDWWDEQPHPMGHGLKIKEVLPAVKLASMLKFGGHAEIHEAAMFWREFAPGGVPIMSPQGFEHALDRLAPLSYSYHGRPPSLPEIVQLSEKSPAEARRYFGDLPDRTYPHVTAAEMVKTLRAAEPHALEHMKRAPLVYEAQYLHHSGENPAAYYRRLAAQPSPAETTIPTDQNGVPVEQRGNAGGRGVETPRRPTTS